MKPMTVKDLLKVTGGTLLSGASSACVSGVVTDSREAYPGALYVPIVGENNDGHAFIEGALGNGASATLTAKTEAFEAFQKAHPENAEASQTGEPSETPAFILVEDTEKALQKIAMAARLQMPMKAVGITGSVGKTTTREMVAAALSAEKTVDKTGKNYNNRFGLPLTLCGLNPEADIAVLELGMNVRGELGTISALCNLDAAVITNIGVAHIEYYGTQDEITKEKFTVTRGFMPDGREKMLFLNADDPYLMKYKKACGYPYILYGTDKDADYSVRNIHTANGRFAYDLYVHGEYRLSSDLAVLGRHNVLNAAAALAVADYFGIDLLKAAASLSEFRGFNKRLERIEHKGYLIIDDTYNASPSSMKAGLDVLEDLSFGASDAKKYAVLGDMFELGDNAKGFHYAVGEYAAGKAFDVLYTVGVNALEIERALKEKGGTQETKHFPNRQALSKALLENLKPGDIVYIKASHGMMLGEVTEALLKDE